MRIFEPTSQLSIFQQVPSLFKIQSHFPFLKTPLEGACHLYFSHRCDGKQRPSELPLGVHGTSWLEELLRQYLVIP